MTERLPSLGIALVAGNRLPQGCTPIQGATPGQRLPDAAYRGLILPSELPVNMSEASTITAAFSFAHACPPHFVVTRVSQENNSNKPSACNPVSEVVSKESNLKQNKAWHKVGPMMLAIIIFLFLLFYSLINQSILPSCYE